MRTYFYISDSRRFSVVREIQQAFDKEKNPWRVNVRNLSFSRDEHGFYIQSDDVILETPVLISKLPIRMVRIEESDVHQYLTEGTYKKGSAQGIVDSFNSGNRQNIRISVYAPSFEEAFVLYTEIRGRKISPLSNWERNGYIDDSGLYGNDEYDDESYPYTLDEDLDS